MTDPLALKARKQAATLERWSRVSDIAINRGVGAAHAHAVVALTDALKRTADGRKSIRRASRSPSYGAACGRLDELWERLTGPSVASLAGLIRDARADFYAEALGLWQAWYPAGHATTAGPAKARLDDVRGLVLHGTELRHEIGAKIDDARRSLLATLERAARRSTPDRVATDLIDGWRSAASAAVARSARGALSGSQVAIDGIAGVDAVRPEYRPRNEFTPS